MYVYVCFCMNFFFNRGHDHLLLTGLMYILYHFPVYFIYLLFFICLSVTGRIKENIFAESDCVLLY